VPIRSARAGHLVQYQRLAGAHTPTRVLLQDTARLSYFGIGLSKRPATIISALAFASPERPQGIHIGLRVIEEVSGEYCQHQVSQRVRELLIDPAGSPSGLPGGVGHVLRMGSRFSDHVRQGVNPCVARRGAW